MNEILEIIKRYNETLITDMSDLESVVYNEEFVILKNAINNYFCIFEANEDICDTEKIVTNIEKSCRENIILSKIKPQFIYSIVIMKTSYADDKIFKKIIEIEENEYFCKKYVFYYSDDEKKEFESWAKKKKKNTFNELINLETNNRDINKSDKNAIAIKFMLKIIIKFIFIKVNIDNKKLISFDNELIKQLAKISDENVKKNLNLFDEEKLDKLISMDLDEAVEEYISKFSEGYYGV